MIHFRAWPRDLRWRPIQLQKPLQDQGAGSPNESVLGTPLVALTDMNVVTECPVGQIWPSELF